MKAVLQRIKDDFFRYKAVIVTFIFYYWIVKFLFNAFCPMVIVAGLPCPGCGMTRAVCFFLTGQFARGWAMNPLALGWIFLGLYVGFMRYIKGKKAKGVKIILVVLLVSMIVFYVYRMLTQFPGAAPISYTGGNLIEKIFPEYGELFRKLKMLRQ